LDETFIYFESKLKQMVARYEFFQKEVGLGLMRGIRVSNDEILNKCVANAFLHRVLVLKAGRTTLRFLPPLTISKVEIDKGFERLFEAYDKI